MKYSVLRLGLFVVVLVLFSVLGADRLVALVGAAVISLLLSYVLLRRPREELARRLEAHTAARLSASADRVDQEAAYEDAADDRARQTPSETQ